MWLPNAFYHRAPHYWIIVGILLIVLGIYLGVEMGSAFLISGVGAGVLSCLWGLRVYLHRSGRKQPVKSVGNTPAAD